LVLPLLATQILWINLMTDTGPALAMGVDPIGEDVMARKPRPRGQRIIDARMGLAVVEAGVVMAVLTLLTLDLFLPGGLIEPVPAWTGPGPHSLDQARTAAFCVLVLTQLFNCFNARSANRLCIPGSRLEPMAVGCGGRVGGAAGGRRAHPRAQPRFRHRAPVGGPMGRVRGDGQRSAVVQRSAKARAPALSEHCLRRL
jgi:hypothetical protein